jgi:hypothetical protein
MLLILSSRLDFAADYLILRLIERGLPYFRINAEELGTASVRFELAESNTAYVTVGGRNLDLATVQSVWYRRGLHPHVNPDVAPSQRAFVAGEIRHAWHGVLLGLNAKWANPIDKVAVAEHKLLQLRLAKELGFAIPKTIVSTCSSELTHFTRSYGATICKPIYHGLVIDGEKRHSAFTRRVKEVDLADERAVSVAPILLQEEVVRRADLRITVVGQHFFGVRITADDPDLIDWRKPGLALSYAVFEVAEHLKSLCSALLSRLGLIYGAFDFIEDQDGSVVFLEVNATGEWAWLEDRLGLPMRDAFVDLFYEAITDD